MRKGRAGRAEEAGRDQGVSSPSNACRTPGPKPKGSVVSGPRFLFKGDSLMRESWINDQLFFHTGSGASGCSERDQLLP